MDSISPVSNKTSSLYAGDGGEDYATASAEFMALLQLASSQVQADGTWAKVEHTVLREESKREAAPKPETRDDTAAEKTRRDDRDTKRASNDRKDKTDDKKADDDTTVKTESKDNTEAGGEAQDAAAAQFAAEGEIIADVVDSAVGEGDAVIDAAQTAQAETLGTTETVVAPEAVAEETVVAAAAVTEAVPQQQQAADGETPRWQQAVRATAQTQKAAVETGPAVQANQNTGDAAKAAAGVEIEQRSAAAVEQSDALSRQLGDEVRARIHVRVDGQNAGEQRFQWSAFNHFVGYNASAANSMSLANGQIGQAQASNALVQDAATNSPAGPIPAPAAPPSPAAAPQPQTQSAQQGNTSSGPAALRAEAAVPQVKGGDAPGQAGSQNSQGSFQSQLSQSTASSQAASQPVAAERPAPQQVVEQIKVNITRAAKAGLDRVTIQLKPAELGRIEVKLELTGDGKVRAMITADNKDTLSLLQNDARGLERALNDAGLRTDANNLEFNLRGESDPRLAGDARQGNGQGGNDAGEGAEDAELADDDAAYIFDYEAAARQRGGVDTFA